MFKTTVRFNTREMTQRLRNLLDAYEFGLKPAFQEAADYMVRSTKNRIYRNLGDPDGEPWPELSDATAKRKGHRRPLIDTGTLAETIQAIHVTNSGFTIRAPARNKDGEMYGKFHQHGLGVPQRRFLGFSETNERRIEKILAEHIRRAIHGG